MNDVFSLFAGGPICRQPQATKEEILLIKLLLNTGKVSQQDLVCSALFGHQASRALINRTTWPNISFTAKFIDEAFEHCQNRVISLVLSVILRGLILHEQRSQKADRFLHVLVLLLIAHAGEEQEEEALIQTASDLRILLEMRKLNGPLDTFDQCLSHAVHAICGLFEDHDSHMYKQVPKHVADCYKAACERGYNPQYDIALSVPAFLLYGWDGRGQPLRSG